MLSCDSCRADNAVAYSLGRRFLAAFKAWAAYFPDAPWIRCFPQVIEPGFVSLLRQPVFHHVVDCRADHLAKSRPALKKSRRSKGSGDSPGCPVPARCPKCFKFDIRAPARPDGQPGAAALRKGSKKFCRDFPESAKSCIRRPFRTVPVRPKTRNVSTEKHPLHRPGFFRRENPVFSLIAADSISLDPAGGLRHAIFSPTMHSPDSAVECDSSRIHDNTKKAAEHQAAFTADGASCTRPIVECAIAPNAVLNG